MKCYIYNISMKGGLEVTKAEAKIFLRICKNTNIIKFNSYLIENNISHSAVSKFINSDDYDDFIGLDKLQLLCDQIYNSCGFIVDMYRENIQHEKIA